MLLVSKSKPLRLVRAGRSWLQERIMDTLELFMGPSSVVRYIYKYIHFKCRVFGFLSDRWRLRVISFKCCYPHIPAQWHMRSKVRGVLGVLSAFTMYWIPLSEFLDKAWGNFWAAGLFRLMGVVWFVTVRSFPCSIMYLFNAICWLWKINANF